MSSFRKPQELNLSEPALASTWRRWPKEWELVYGENELENKPDKVQNDIFFHCAGLAAQERYSHFERMRMPTSCIVLYCIDIQQHPQCRGFSCWGDQWTWMTLEILWQGIEEDMGGCIRSIGGRGAREAKVTKTVRQVWLLQPQRQSAPCNWKNL